jgi:hypothetical protein
MAFLQKYLKEIIIIIGAWILIDKISSSLGGNKTSQEDLADKDKLQTGESKITKEQALIIANNFYTALAGTSLGKNSSLLYAQFEKLKSQEDFNMVYNAFGKRQFSRFWDNVGDKWTSDLVDLITILTVEISAVEQAFIKGKYPHLNMFGG